MSHLTPIGIIGIIFIILGVIMSIIAITILILSRINSKPWYVWILLILGVLLGITGSIFLAIGLSNHSDEISLSTV